jgi:hypothetical protein
MAEVMQRMQGLFDRVFTDARERMPLPYQPLALRNAVADVDHFSVQDRIRRPQRRGARPRQRPADHGVLGAMLRRSQLSRVTAMPSRGWPLWWPCP